LKCCLADNRGYITNQDLTTPIGQHFNSPGHSLSDFSITIFENIRSQDHLYRKEREKYFMRKFNTFYRGVNGQQWN
jgi:hypothetical protein